MIAHERQSSEPTSRLHTRLSGAVMVGGASRRMGRPKAQLHYQGCSFLEQILVTLRPFVERLYVVGGTNAHDALQGVDANTRAEVGWLPDVAAQAGPLAGIVAALQHDKTSDWLCMACDMPAIEPAALRWLIDQYHRVNSDVVAARLGKMTAPEPFPAIYARAALGHLLNVLMSQPRGLRTAMLGMRCFTPLVPSKLDASWSNINSPLDWDLLNDPGATQPSIACEKGFSRERAWPSAR